MTSFSDSILRQVFDAWLHAWQGRRVAAHGLSMSAILLATALVAALARRVDPFFMPFAGLAGFFAWLWWFSINVALAKRGQYPSWHFHTDFPADARSSLPWKFSLPSALAMLALAAGGLHAVFPSALGMLVLFPLQWAGAALLLVTLPAAFAAAVALSLADAVPSFSGFRHFVAWSILENPRVWAVLLYLILLAELMTHALDWVFWMHPDIHRLWPHILTGPAFGQAPPAGGHAAVAALHAGILLILLPLQGHLVVFVARLASSSRQESAPSS